MPDPSGARHLARIRQLRRIKKAPLHRARHPMQRTDPDRAGLASRLELGRHLQELRPTALLDRASQTAEPLGADVLRPSHRPKQMVAR